MNTDVMPQNSIYRMKIRECGYVFILLLLTATVCAQAPLSFEQALGLTMAHNYDIRLSQVDVEVAENNADRGANGFLPSLSGSGGYNWTYFTGTNQLRDEDRTFDPNSSYNYNAGLTLSYSIFDGFGRKYRYQQAVGQARLSALQLKRLTENTVLELSSVYHEVARLEQQTASLDSSLLISRDRLQRAEYGKEYGQTTTLDVLNAEVDLDTDSINLLNSRQQLENTRRSLHLLMGVPIDTLVEVRQDVRLRRDLTAEMVMAAAEVESSQVLSAQQSRQIAELGIDANRSAWYPAIGASAGYQYRGSDDPNGAFLIGSSSYGPTAGIDLSWTIFDGRDRTAVQNAKLQKERSDIALAQTKDRVRTQALNAFGSYQNALFVLEARDASVATAERNFERSKESYRLGQITSVEFRQAQINLLNAELLLSQALYTAKNAELETLVLMGELVGE